MWEREEEGGEGERLRDAEDYSSLARVEESGPVAGIVIDPLEDALSDIPVFAAEQGGVLTSAAKAEAEIGTPREFRKLSPQAQAACRLKAGGARTTVIARMLRYNPDSVRKWLKNPLAQKYIAWLQARLDDHLGPVQEAMHMLGMASINRIAEIVYTSKNENLVAKCSFNLLDRIGFKPAERIVVENSNAIRPEDIEAMNKVDKEIANVLEQGREAPVREDGG
jgi:hypothetical protein